MAERAHMSIGEVLSLLQEEFPDVTISKIRFLESQGLLVPERTPSGYRKFYEPDIERLRWILQQQRNNFLPLRVIKDRLEGRPDSESVESVESVEADGAGDEGTAATPEPQADTRPQPADSGAMPSPGGTRAAHPHPTASTLDSGPSAVSLTRQELAAAAGLPDKIITDLERYGLVAGRPM